MIRVTRSNTARKWRKKILKAVKGYRGKNSKLSTFAKEQFRQSFFNQYISRRLKKRDIKTLWIIRINALARQLGLSYSYLLKKLKSSNIFINKKMLSLLTQIDQNNLIQLIKLLPA